MTKREFYELAFDKLKESQEKQEQHLRDKLDKTDNPLDKMGVIVGHTSTISIQAVIEALSEAGFIEFDN